MMGDAPAKNPSKAAALNFGLIPSKRLAPPATNAAPVAVTARSGFGTSLAHVLRHILMFAKMMNAIVEEIITEQGPAQQERSLHKTSASNRSYDSPRLEEALSSTHP